MDIVLLSEVIKEQDLWAYPYNALRNQALARADTDVSHSPLIRPCMSAGYLSGVNTSCKPSQCSCKN